MIQAYENDDRIRTGKVRETGVKDQICIKWHYGRHAYYHINSIPKSIKFFIRKINISKWDVYAKTNKAD